MFKMTNMSSYNYVLTSKKAMAWAMWLVASFFYAYQYILRVLPNIVMNDIMTNFDIDATTFGQFSGVYYIGYSLMHIPIGILLDRIGPKKMMPIFILLTVLGILPLVCSQFWVYPIIGRFITGIGSSAAILGLFKIIRLSFKEERFTTMLGVSVTIGLIGAIYGGGPVFQMYSKFGFEYVIQMLMIIGVILAIITYFVIQNDNQGQTLVQNEAHNPVGNQQSAPLSEPASSQTFFKDIFQDIFTVFKNGNVVTICVLAGLMVGPLEGFADVWGTEFLKQVYHFDDAVAASLPSLIFLGMCFGAPFLSLLAEKTNKYLTIILTSAILMALGFIAILSKILNVTSMSVIFVAMGILCAYQILAIYKASTYVPEKISGLTTAVANMIIMLFGYLFHTLIGKIVNSFTIVDPSNAIIGAAINSKTAVEASSTASAALVYSPDAFIYGISIIPTALAISALGFVMLIIRQRRKLANDRA